MPESFLSSSCLAPDQSTANAFSSMPVASQKPFLSPPDTDAPLELDRSNENLLGELDRETSEQPSTVPQTPLKHAAAAASSSETTISKVEAVIESVIDGMLHRQPELAIPIRVKKRQQQQTRGSHEMTCSSSYLPATAASAVAPAWTRVLVRFPGRNGQESWRFS